MVALCMPPLFVLAECCFTLLSIDHHTSDKRMWSRNRNEGEVREDRMMDKIRLKRRRMAGIVRHGAIG